MYQNNWKYSFYNCFLLLILVGSSTKAQDTLNILFVGNSITYFNNMPQTFEAIANDLGNPVKVTMYAPGGTGFIHHVADPNVYHHFRQGIWDYVVLQPGSNESPGYSSPIQQTLSRARQLKDSIKLYNPCSQILYYEISYGVWGNSANDLNTYNTTMDSIRKNLEILADSTECFFAPVGEAFRTAWNDDLNTILWGGYGNIHPNGKGSYIAACVFYASIFQQSSLGTTITTSLSSQDANQYQLLADTTVLNYLNDWRINTYTPTSSFNYQVNGTTANFNHTFGAVDSVVWDFGDGNTSSNSNPTHYYNTAGNYTIMLTAYANGCTYTQQQTISIVSLHSNLITLNTNWSISPNPAHSQISIQSLSENFSACTFIIYNNIGHVVAQYNQPIIDVSSLPSGSYFLKYLNHQTNTYNIKKWVKY